MKSDGLGETPEAITAFVSHARGFRALVETCDAQSEREFLLDVSRHLAALYSLGIQLQGKGGLEPPEPPAEGDWSWAMGRLEPFLSRTDEYRKIQATYPESAEQDATIEGCLANDLSTIYRYAALFNESAADQAKMDAAAQFTREVGEQVVDALKAIYSAEYDDFLFKR